MSDLKYPRGSEWRKWDLHIHSPASFHWDGQKFDPDVNAPENVKIVDDMIHALNAAEPAVFAIMDYWTFDGWFALKNRLAQLDAPKLHKTVFPGIELRLVAPMTGRLNAHVVFSDHIADQSLKDFQSRLNVAIINQPLSNHSLQSLARRVGEDLLIEKGFKKNEVDTDDNVALEAGSIVAEITCDSYKLAISGVPNGMALGFMPFDTNDGIADVKWQEHYSYVLELFDSSPIFETRKSATYAAFSGIKTEENEKWIDSFQRALGNIPRLAVSGSDAHRFVGKVSNDQRGYGDYPSGKITWIKADPTFEGLKQAIKEPAKRSYMGGMPPKIKKINENKSLFIDSLKIKKLSNSQLSDEWLNDTDLLLNPDLVAIIGNKGSGKSALADITALLGNSKQSHHFSFLKESRFRGKTGDPAKQFHAQSTWLDGNKLVKNLNENPKVESVELVKYIPQGHFEDLCNAHVSGKSDAFEKELRSVIFSHADETIRLGAFNFDQLIEKQESSLRSRIDGLKSELQTINYQIASTENQILPEVRNAIEEQLSQKQRVVSEHNKIKPKEIIQPTGELSEQQQKASTTLNEIAKELEKITLGTASYKEELITLATKNKAGRNIREGLAEVNRSVEQFFTRFTQDANHLGLDLNEIIKLQTNEQLIADIDSKTTARETIIIRENLKLQEREQVLTKSKDPLSAQLNAPQQAYQNYLAQLKDWEEKKASILGSSDLPDTLKGLEHRKIELDKLPERRIALQVERLEKTAKIFDLLSEQRANREALFQPVQQLIQSNSLIRDEYRLQFKAELSSTTELITDRLFAIVKQNSGEFRGESESFSTIKELTDRYDINNKKSLLLLLTELHDKLEDSSSGQVGIASILRKNRSANEVYDFLFSLDYLTPRYTLMFQGAHIEQLSPGQRGSLLLIFYLLVDKGNTPIILDQPEENLDNETIVSLLVPVLNEAKQKRQIIMVTHNPNLAVVCDSEQIIHCEIDRKNGQKISYTAGGIECGLINKKVVDVLEGTMPAFDNRRMKYH